MMAGLTLVFALVMVFSVYQFSALQESKRLELTEKENQLIALQAVQQEQQNKLDEQTEALAAAQRLQASQRNTLDVQDEALLASRQALEQKQAELDVQDQALRAAQAQLAAAQISLQAQRQQLESQGAQLSTQQALMEQQQQRIDALVGVRTRIIEDLRDQLRAANRGVTVDVQTGAITLKGAVLFDVDRSDLREGGKSLLDGFFPVYVHTLLDGSNSDYVAEIIIEGHTDTTGSFLYNLDLSQKRAYAVAAYCLQDGFSGLSHELRNRLRVIVTANGRSWSSPVRYADGSVNEEASRRVEFKFRLKEAEMINEMSAIMESPAFATPAPTSDPTPAPEP
jgi:chemotaxis protein MotB